MSMYEDWLMSIDRLFLLIVGMSIHEMSDFCWRDMYQDGESPSEALAEACEMWVEWDGMPEEIVDMVYEHRRKEMETYLTEEEKAAGGILHLRAKKRGLI